MSRIIVHTVFILTYGGGLVAGDTVDFSVNLAPTTRLILLTQGSTKIFKTPDPKLISKQRMTVNVNANAGLVYLPEPVQPFEASAFEQAQTYNLHSKTASLCVCDWVSEGRTARGEKWRFWKYASKNEVWGVHEAKRQLLLRDNVILDGEDASRGYEGRVDNLGVFGTLILCGPLFSQLASWFLRELKLLPRIGARTWGDEETKEPNEVETRRQMRHQQEVHDGVLWTASSVRGFVLVKFGAREVEGIKKWLSSMLKEEGSVPERFGERALLCLR